MTNSRERILLLLFLSALFVGGGIIGWRSFSRHLQEQRTLLEQKQTQLEEARLWLNEKERWLSREQWVEGNRPPAYAGQQTEAAFVQEMQASLASHSVEILEQRIEGTLAAGTLMETKVDFVTSAPLENLIRWLHTIQSPEAFRSVDHIKLKSDENNTKIRAEISLVQFHEKSGSPPPK